MHQYVAAGATALLIQDCLRGKETPGWSRIMVLRPQWLPLPLPPTCHLLPLLLPLPAMPSAAAATVAPPQIDLSDSNSYCSTDDNSGSCKIIELVGNKGKTSFVCLSGDVQRVELDKAKANSSKGNLNASSHEVAKTMLHSVVVRRAQLIELAGGLDATMEIPDGGGETSICDLLSRAIPTSIPTRITKISVAVHMVDIWVIMSTMLKIGVLLSL